jgi:hypothetical protein
VFDNPLFAIGGTEGCSENDDSQNRAFLWQPGQKGDKAAWRCIADLPRAQSEHCAAAHNGQLIVAGGAECYGTTFDGGGDCADIETSAASNGRANGQTWTTDGTLGMFTRACPRGRICCECCFPFRANSTRCCAWMSLITQWRRRTMEAPIGSLGASCLPRRTGNVPVGCICHGRQALFQDFQSLLAIHT